MGLYILHPDETLEQLRAKVQEIAERPAFLSARCHLYGSGKYRLPAESKWTIKNRLAVYLSTFTDNGRCVERNSEGELFYDLVKASQLYLIVPLTQEEEAATVKGHSSPAAHWFDQIGYQTIETITPPAEETVPENLLPYLRDRKTRQGTKLVFRPGISFAYSCAIEQPKELRATWSTDFTWKPSAGIQATSLIPPGWYDGIQPHRALHRFNLTLLVDQDPTNCIVCHGRNNERRQIAWVKLGPDPYPSNAICKVCFPDAVAQWQQLLEDWKA